ncbi:MAG: methylated-DNA--[protein]-cysteine S-methyltransferase [Thermodesulfobacteriota bacterium]
MPLPDAELVIAGRLALELTWKDGKLASLTLSWSDGLTPSPAPSPGARALAAALEKYVAGEVPLWPSLPLDFSGLSPFARDVLTALRDGVPHGATVSYGNLARMAGHPGAARAVGRVMGSNPWPLLAPCHRVVGSDGSLVGFGGCGLPMKKYLLQLESARP